MHLREGEFEKAHTDFFEAFKNYDESGSPRRTTCLKYLVLANMLMKSGINPFDSQEVLLEIWLSQLDILSYFCPFFFFFCLCWVDRDVTLNMTTEKNILNLNIVSCFLFFVG